MINTVVSALHKYGRYPLGLNTEFQFDSGRSYDRLKRVCYRVALLENARIKALDTISSLVTRFIDLWSWSPPPRNEVCFKYPAIRQTSTWRTIRLLQLHGGRPGQPLVGTLSSFTMATIYLWTWSFDMPSYEALSYCWGTDGVEESITIDGRLLGITKSLHIALDQLRLETRDRYLWIDQICIDQEKVRNGDYSEKNHQVQRMGEIYANAQRTVVWLGNGDDFSTLLFNALDRIDDSVAENRSMYFWAEIQPGRPIYKAVDDELCRIATAVRLPNALLQSMPEAIQTHAGKRVLAWALFDYVLKNPWFERLWILQESALAHDIVIQSGSVSIPWRRFVGAMRIMSPPPGKILPPKGQQSVEVVEVLRHSWYTLDGLKIDLARMLEFSRPREATNVRDKIYGLTGLHRSWSIIRMPAGSLPAVEPGSHECIAYSNFYDDHGSTGPPLPVVDYQKSVEQVFIDTALALLASGKLDILKDCCAYEEIPPAGTPVNSFLHGSYTSNNPAAKHALPSWAYDWSISAEGPCRSPLVDDLRTKEQPFHACGNKNADVRVVYEVQPIPVISKTSLENTAISMTGILFDVIEEVVEQVHTHENSTEMMSRDIWADWTRIALKSADEGPYIDRDGCLEAFWRALICDKIDGLGTDRAPSSTGLSFASVIYETIVRGDLPAGYEARSAPSGRVYYVDNNTETTGWAHPREDSITYEEFLRRSEPLRQWLTRCGNRHMNRRLFRTVRGYIGLSCPHVKSGDIVAVLWGGRLPFILRPRTRIRLLELDGQPTRVSNIHDGGEDDAFKAYELIGGECYVHGIVDGEVFDATNGKHNQATTIYLQ